MTPECESAYKETRFNTRQFKCNIHRTIYLWTRNANLRIILYIYGLMTLECESAFKETRFNTRQFKFNIHRTIYLWPRMRTRVYQCRRMLYPPTSYTSYHPTSHLEVSRHGRLFHLELGNLSSTWKLLSYNCSFSPSFQFSDYFSFGSVAYVAGLLFANNWWYLLCYTGYFADPGPVLASYTESTGYKIWGRQCTVMWWLQPIWTYRSRNHSNLCKSSLRSMAWMDQCVHWIDRPPPFHWYLRYDDGPRVIGARPHWKISPLTPKLPVSKTRIGSPWIMLCLPSICVLPTPWRWIYLRQWVV